MADPFTRKKKISNLVQRFPDSCEVACSVGKIYWQKGALDKAEKWLQKAVELGPRNADCPPFSEGLL